MATVYIYFGSQTGTGEGFAKDLGKYMTEKGIRNQVIDLEDFSEDVLKNQEYCVFFQSTYGRGRCTSNAKMFFDWMKSHESQKTLLSKLKFAVFGLGHHGYPKYQAAAILMDGQLASMGATKLMPLSMGDAAVDIDADFEKFRDAIVEKIRPLVALKETNMNMFQSNNSQLYELVNEKLNQMNPCFDFVESQFSCIRNKKFPHFQGYLETTIRENEELCRNLNAPDARSIRKIVFDLPEPVQYDTAGIASIIPQNPLQLVQLLVKRLGLNEFKTFNVAKNGSEVISVSLLHLLTQYLDFLSPISSDQVLVLCRYASNESEFSELSSVVLDESGTTLKEWKAKRLCLLDVLEMYRSVMIPDFVLVQMLPSMKPRKYSISSSSKTSSQSLALTVSHVKLFTQGVMQQGLCSSFLCGSSVGDHVLLNVESSSFSIPDHVETPMILLGMGCGCSPIRSIVEDNAQQTKDMRPLYLYLGCRNRNIDLIYEEEFLDWKQKGVINEIHYAFSRDGNEKKYVQDSLREQGDLIWDLISNQNATLFMCGSKQMGIDVVNTLVQIAMVYGLMSDELAHGFVSKLQNSEKIVGELF